MASEILKISYQDVNIAINSPLFDECLSDSEGHLTTAIDLYFEQQVDDQDFADFLGSLMWQLYSYNEAVNLGVLPVGIKCPVKPINYFEVIR